MKYFTITTDEVGVLKGKTPHSDEQIRVVSTEIMPLGLCKGQEAFIIDKADIAIFDGKATWYRYTNGSVRSAACGQPWSALFT